MMGPSGMPGMGGSSGFMRGGMGGPPPGSSGGPYGPMPGGRFGPGPGSRAALRRATYPPGPGGTFGPCRPALRPAVRRPSHGRADRADPPPRRVVRVALRANDRPLPPKWPFRMVARSPILAGRAALRAAFGRRLKGPTLNQPLRLAVLLSGGGTTLQNLLDHAADGRMPARVVLVVSSNPEAFGLGRRRSRPAFPRPSWSVAVCPLCEEFSRRIFEYVRGAGAELGCLAGFLQLLSIPNDYRGRILNIHPSLIPAFCGKGFHGARPSGRP